MNKNKNKKDIYLKQKDSIKKEGDEEIKKVVQNIEKGNEEIIKVFDNFIKDHVEYIDDNAYDKAMNPKEKEIGNNLDIIEDESEIHNLKLFKRSLLLFKSNDIIYNDSSNSKDLKEGCALNQIYFIINYFHFLSSPNSGYIL